MFRIFYILDRARTKIRGRSQIIGFYRVIVNCQIFIVVFFQFFFLLWLFWFWHNFFVSFFSYYLFGLWLLSQETKFVFFSVSFDVLVGGHYSNLLFRILRFLSQGGEVFLFSTHLGIFWENKNHLFGGSFLEGV